MNDNRRIYRRIMTALKQLYPPRVLNGHQLRHLNTLAAMIAGIVQSKSCHLEKIARKLPDDTQVESRVKRYSRFAQKTSITDDLFFLPFIQPLISALAKSSSITLAMDGSTTGQGCITLMVSIIYRKRAIPLLWKTVKGKKGHLPEATHLALFERVRALFPEDCDVIFLGDGEFDGIGLQAAITQAGWKYVCRTAKNRLIIVEEGEQFALSELGIEEGSSLELTDVGFTQKGYRVSMVIIWWKKGYEKPIYLVTNMECAGEACSFYRRRFRIETFFSDQKSRGFNLHKSHLSDPERVGRLLVAACLAYIWIIYLGVDVSEKQEVMKHIHRTDRCDLSLFQLGLRYLEYLLNYGKAIPFSFVLPA